MATYVRQERNYIDLNEYQCSYLRDPNDSIEMNIDGSTTPVEFRHETQSGFYFLVHRICFVILSQVPVNSDKFGGINGGLSNGCLLQVQRKGKIIKDLFAGAPVKRNGEWASFSGIDVDTIPGDRGIGARWTFTRAGGFPLRLHSDDIMKMTIQDNLTSLPLFRTMLHGYVVQTEIMDDERLK